MNRPSLFAQTSLLRRGVAVLVLCALGWALAPTARAEPRSMGDWLAVLGIVALGGLALTVSELRLGARRR